MSTKRTPNEILNQYKEAFEIVRTARDKEGNVYTLEGTLNQAAWIGENAGWLINRVENLEAISKALLSKLPYGNEALELHAENIPQGNHVDSLSVLDR